jgi:hypothetical protein
MNQRMVVSASLLVTLVLTACGGDSARPTPAAFSDQLSSVCRTIGRGIGNLDQATSLDEIRSNATDASALFESGINELHKLSIPTSDQEFAGDAGDLIASFEDQLDTLDAIAKAAKEGDQAAVDTKISKLTDQAADSNDLADSLDVSRCQFDPVFEVAPPTTEPAVPLTLPIATLPPETLPFDTIPFNTAPGTSNKTIESSSGLVPKGDYTFADAPDDAMTSFQSLLDLAPSMAAQSGRITGVGVFDSNGQVMGRVFAFESDTDPLTPGSVEEDTPYLTSDIPTTPRKIGTLNGLTWSDPDGTTYFLVSLSNVVLWALSPSADLLEPALRAWGESIAQ